MTDSSGIQMSAMRGSPAAATFAEEPRAGGPARRDSAHDTGLLQYLQGLYRLALFCATLLPFLASGLGVLYVPEGLTAAAVAWIRPIPVFVLLTSTVYTTDQPFGHPLKRSQLFAGVPDALVTAICMFVAAGKHSSAGDGAGASLCPCTDVLFAPRAPCTGVQDGPMVDFLTVQNVQLSLLGVDEGAFAPDAGGEVCCIKLPCDDGVDEEAVRQTIDLAVNVLDSVRPLLLVLAIVHMLYALLQACRRQRDKRSTARSTRLPKKKTR